MSRVGFVGLGKLGLPVALAIESKGHEVFGLDTNPAVATYLQDKHIPFTEEGIQPLLDNNKITLVEDTIELVRESDIVFIAVQTPHDPQFEGTTRLPEERADFNYDYLVEAVADVAKGALFHHKSTTVVVISTCLPGTYEKRIKDLLNPYVRYIYNPFFIAMGTVLKDFLNPEFVLLGREEVTTGLADLVNLYQTIHGENRTFITDITTAEGIKVFYNTFITMKTVLANTYGEMAHKLGMNVDHIYSALALATDRITSPKYLQAGMGDGGGCHPRDNIALSWLADQVDLSHNIFEDLMAAREDHTEFLADLILEQDAPLPAIILGRAFKPETNIETGSPSILLANILREKGREVLHVEDANMDQRAIFFIGTKHKRYSELAFREGSIVIDPFGDIPRQQGVEVIRVGRP